MITAEALGKICQAKGLALYQNVTMGTRKVYAVTKIGETTVLYAGYLGRCRTYIESYK